MNSKLRLVVAALTFIAAPFVGYFIFHAATVNGTGLRWVGLIAASLLAMVGVITWPGESSTEGASGSSGHAKK